MAKILVIDDDATHVELLKESLQSEGFAIIKGYDGDMAQELASAHAPNLIIMDVNMPVCDGIEALHGLRECEGTSNIPVIFLTSVPSETLSPEIDFAAQVKCLKKPVDLAELYSTVRYFLHD